MNVPGVDGRKSASHLDESVERLKESAGACRCQKSGSSFEIPSLSVHVIVHGDAKDKRVADDRSLRIG